MTTKLAFFGATGGCVGFCLASALKAGYSCTALARTPSKLEAGMREKGVDEAMISSNLTIVSGDVHDLEAVKKTVTGAETIISGIGPTPTMQWSVRMPLVATDPTLCGDAMVVILTACREMFKTGAKPRLIVLSTTGIQQEGKPNDVPLSLSPLYHWLLKGPHKDKRAQEDAIRGQMKLAQDERGFSEYTIVRPTLLFDGAGKPLDAVRVGTEDQPSRGYGIDRSAVGQFIFQRLIEDEVKSEWRNNSVTLTY